MKPTYVVYFVQGEQDTASPVKIGLSALTTLVQRVGHIQNGNPHRLCVRGVIYCQSRREAQAKELELHHAFRDTRMAGEWFEHSAPLRLAINRAEPYARPRCARCDEQLGYAGKRMCQPCATSLAAKNRFLKQNRTEGGDLTEAFDADEGRLM